MHFADWIATRRKALRLSQSECAERAGVSTPVWCEYENVEKQAQPRRSTVEKIARALEVSLDEALIEAGYSLHSAPDVPARLLASWRKVAAAPMEKQRAWLDSVDRSADLVSI